MSGRPSAKNFYTLGCYERASRKNHVRKNDDENDGTQKTDDGNTAGENNDGNIYDGNTNAEHHYGEDDDGTNNNESYNDREITLMTCWWGDTDDENHDAGINTVENNDAEKPLLHLLMLK